MRKRSHNGQELEIGEKNKGEDDGIVAILGLGPGRNFSVGAFNIAAAWAPGSGTPLPRVNYTPCFWENWAQVGLAEFGATLEDIW